MIRELENGNQVLNRPARAGRTGSANES